MFETGEEQFMKPSNSNSAPMGRNKKHRLAAKSAQSKIAGVSKTEIAQPDFLVILDADRQETR